MNTNKQLNKGNTMKKVIMMIGLISVIGLNLNTAANALVLVDGYFKSNGTYVQPHYRSSPNSTKSDNWSTIGNTNPYTGKQGTRRNCGVGSSLLSC